MFFQFNISPVKKAKPKKQVLKEPEEVAVLSLAPFTANPKISFEDVGIGSMATRKLIISNPTTRDVEIYVTRMPPEERHLSLSWQEKNVLSNGEVELELQWCPDVVGGWRDMLTFDDGYRLKKDVSVTFKSISPKKPKTKTGRAAPYVISTKVKSPPNRLRQGRRVTIKSPPKKYLSPAKLPRSPLININRVPSVIIEGPERRGTYTLNGKENVDTADANVQFGCAANAYVSPKTSLLKNARRNNLRCDTFCVSTDTAEVLQLNRDKFHDSLELSSPELNTSSPNARSINGVLNCVIEEKLKKVLFTPDLYSPQRENTFIPSMCSTGEKCKSYLANTTYEFELKHSPLDTTIQTNFLTNANSASYTKDNVSLEECGKGNLTSDTYVKCNVSGTTYVKDQSLDITGSSIFLNPNVIKSSSPYSPKPSPGGSDASLSRLQNLSGDNAKKIIEANLWCRDYPKSKLDFIREESVVHNRCSDSLVETPMRFGKKRKSNSVPEISPPKVQILENKKSWSRKSVNKSFRPVKSLNINAFFNKPKSPAQAKEKPVVLHDPDGFLRGISNPFILRATNAIDPFMSSIPLYDPQWMTDQEKYFTKWLNALLTPPEELNSETDGPIDVTKLWQDCRQRDVSKAPTKELVSSKYHVSSRLDSLRKASINLFRSPDISRVLGEVHLFVDNQKLMIRKDRDIHLDLGLQYEIMSLFLSYNPLWLRIGLETVYGVSIPLSSNSDVIGLSSFVSENFFKNASLLKKYKTVHSPKYAVELKKFALKKFLMLVFFLDQAKIRQLIAHDPCLFCRNAALKESREILLKFSRDTLHAVGDITKYIKLTGYVLTHKQTYIHEFDYAVTDLGRDLRDGVRLTKTMEIILLVKGLVPCLRVPAISRLQKIHNMKIVFDALTDAGFEILYDISPKDIADGHREKTLSFLWQIIYKFQAPRITKAVADIQKWWRCLQIIIKRRILARERDRREAAALKIQRWYRRTKVAVLIERLAPALKEYLMLQKMAKAAVKIQSYFRMSLERKRYLKSRECVITIQSYARRSLVLRQTKHKMISIIKIQAFIRMYLVRSRYLKMKSAVLKIEERYVARKLMIKQFHFYRKLKSTVLFIEDKLQANKQMRIDRERFLQLRKSVVVLQQTYRNRQRMKLERSNYLRLKNATLVIQSRFRAERAMREQRGYYIALKNAVLTVQNRYRAKRAMEIERAKYEALRGAALVVQRRYRAKKTMEVERLKYEKLREAVRVTQARYRANSAMKLQRRTYQELRMSVVVLQLRYRAIRAMREQRNYYLTLRNAAVVLQERYRAKQLASSQRRSYLKLRNAVLTVQRRYRAKKAMENERTKYEALRRAALVVQERYRAKRSMELERMKYEKLKEAVRVIQVRYRANQAMKLQTHRYQDMRQSIVIVQQRYRAIRAMREQRSYYVTLRNAAVILQRRYRAKLLASSQRSSYLQLRNAVLTVQNRYRAKRAMEKERAKYEALRGAALVVQRRYRAKKTMEVERLNYEKLREAVRVTQARYRANSAMKLQISTYQELRMSVVVLQLRYRAIRAMREQRNYYLTLRNAAVVLQQRYRAKQLASSQRGSYLKLRNAVVTVQRRYRAKKAMENERTKYEALRRAVLVVQERYRAKRSMELERMKYEKLKQAVRVIQVRYRANQAMKLQMCRYQDVRQSIVMVQQRYCAKRAMQTERAKYEAFKRAVLVIQRRYRAKKSMERERLKYEKLKGAVRAMQERYRATRAMKLHRDKFQELRTSTLILQRRYRANKSMQEQREYYACLRTAAITIQVRYRAVVLMRIERRNYLQLREATVFVQVQYRARKLMQVQRSEYRELRMATLFVQAHFRANRAAKYHAERYRETRNAVLKIQRWYRASRLMKVERGKYKSTRNAVILIQRLYLARKARQIAYQNYHRLRSAVICVQSRYRAMKSMEMQRNFYRELRDAAVIIQRRYRATKLMRTEREKYQKVRNAVLMIQAKFRANKAGFVQRAVYQKMRAAAVVLQSYFRAHLKMKREKTVYIKKITAIVKIQTCARRFLARKRYRMEIDTVLEESRRVRILKNAAATKIQAAWRGYRTRSTEQPRVMEIRERVKRASKQAKPENTIAQNKSQAIRILTSSYETLQRMIDALRSLEFVTRVSRDSCFTLSETLSPALYKLMNSTCRSLPDMTVCSLSASILINFCKYLPARPNCWHPEYMDTVVTIMGHWCDKEGPLFLNLCTLIWLFAHNEQYKAVIKGTPKFEQRMGKMKRLCLRKQHMVSRNPIRGFEFLAYTNLPMPSCDPDWGISYEDRPRTFNNCIHALNSLLNILDLDVLRL